MRTGNAVSRGTLRSWLTVAATLATVIQATPLTAQPPPNIKPGPEHELLKDSEGEWDLTFKGQGDCKATSSCKVGLGGFWLVEHVKADFGGQAYEGRGATTYDPDKKKYVNIWIDSMSPSPLICEGTYDKAAKTLTLAGNMILHDGKSTKVTLVIVHKDGNTKTFTLNGVGPDGKDAEMFQITYKRRGK